MNRIIKTFILGLLAGASICLGASISVLCSSFIPSGNILGSFLFPIGLILICVFSFNLYTGKIGFFFSNSDKKHFAIDLFVMLLGNLLICLLLGYILNFVFSKNTQISNYLNSLYQSKTTVSPINCLISSCFCGFFVYSAVFCYKKFSVMPFKILGILLSIALFCLMRFDHCIANTFYFALCGQISSPNTYLYILIAIIGNSLGAILLNSFIN